MPAVNFIYSIKFINLSKPAFSFSQALRQPSIRLSYIVTREADTTYEASSKAKGKQPATALNAITEETHASAALHD